MKRIVVHSDADLAAVVADVSSDKEPRVIERDGKVLAAVISIEDLPEIRRRPTREDIERALELAGAWSDMDTEALKKEIYRWRHEAPPSEPANWCYHTSQTQISPSTS